MSVAILDSAVEELCMFAEAGNELTNGKQEVSSEIEKEETENCKVKEVVDDFVPHNTFVQIKDEQDL